LNKEKYITGNNITVAKMNENFNFLSFTFNNIKNKIITDIKDIKAAKLFDFNNP
jgi:hypothetical protein